MASGLGLDGFRNGRRKGHQDDIEAAAAFDEAELDELTLPADRHREKFVVDEDDDDDDHNDKRNGQAS